MGRKKSKGLAVILALILITVPFYVFCQEVDNGAAGGKEVAMKQDTKLTFFLSGDIMPGRGIDQILPYSVDPVLYEPYVRNARVYVELAEQVNGPLDRPVQPAYIWGDALTVLDKIRPDLRIINLETSMTTSGEYWPKGINYRMHPANIKVLTAAGINCCLLANNHVLDWEHDGLVETLETLKHVNIKQAGAGHDRNQAVLPAVFKLSGKGRVLVFSYGSTTSGIPFEWAAQQQKPGINLLQDLSMNTVNTIQKTVAAIRQPDDIVLISIHWGDNWGYIIPEQQQRFAHWLIDEVGADLIHGHSSHHVKGIEVYRNRLILYGCGDFLNDYEGISGHEKFRADLTLMYFPSLSASTGELVELRLVPMQIKRFQTVRPTKTDTQWLFKLLNRLGAEFKTRVKLHEDNSMSLLWKEE